MVYLYYANLIGYVRVGCLLVSCFTAFTHPITTVVCYFLSQALDWVDGPIARKYDQCSEYGAILDMVTDRVSDAVFLAILAGLFPNWAWFFFLDIILDIGSHWYQTLSTAMGREESHKTATTEWRLLHIYYHNYTFLSVLIAGNEVLMLVFSFSLFACTWSGGETSYGVPTCSPS